MTVAEPDPGALRERRAHVWDVTALLELERACYPQHGAYTRGDYLAALLRPRAIHRLLREPGSGVPAAFGGAFLEAGGRRGRIYTLNVRPDLQGRGLGHRLLETLEARMRRVGVRTVELEVWVENTPAIHLYEAHGYERVKRLRGYYKTYPGSGDAWLYRKRLD